MDPKIPLVGWIGRLDFQKGPDVVLQSVAPMAQRGCQVSTNSCLAENNTEAQQGRHRVSKQYPSVFVLRNNTKYTVLHSIMDMDGMQVNKLPRKAVKSP